MARCQRRHAPHAASPFSRDRRPGSEHTGNALASFRQPLTAGQHRTSMQLMLHKRTACFTHNRKTIKKVGSVFPLGLKSPSSRCSLRCKCLRHSKPVPQAQLLDSQRCEGHHCPKHKNTFIGYLIRKTVLDT